MDHYLFEDTWNFTSVILSFCSVYNFKFQAEV